MQKKISEESNSNIKNEQNSKNNESSTKKPMKSSKNCKKNIELINSDYKSNSKKLITNPDNIAKETNKSKLIFNKINKEQENKNHKKTQKKIKNNFNKSKSEGLESSQEDIQSRESHLHSMNIALNINGNIKLDEEIKNLNSEERNIQSQRNLEEKKENNNIHIVKDKDKENNNKKDSEKSHDQDDLIFLDDEEFGGLKDNHYSSLKKTKCLTLSNNPFLTRSELPNNFGFKEIRSSKDIKNNINLKEQLNLNEEKDLLQNRKLSTLNTSTSIKEKNHLEDNNDNLFSECTNEKDKKILVKFFDGFSNTKNHIDINYKDKDGFSVLHHACELGNLKIVEALINAKCELNSTDKDKNTPLHLATKKGNISICKILIDNGALLDIYNNDKITPSHIAFMNNNLELVDLFLQKLSFDNLKKILGSNPNALIISTEIKVLLEKYFPNNFTAKKGKIKIYNQTTKDIRKTLKKNINSNLFQNLLLDKKKEKNENKEDKEIKEVQENKENSAIRKGAFETKKDETLGNFHKNKTKGTNTSYSSKVVNIFHKKTFKINNNTKNALLNNSVNINKNEINKNKNRKSINYINDLASKNNTLDNLNKTVGNINDIPKIDKEKQSTKKINQFNINSKNNILESSKCLRKKVQLQTNNLFNNNKNKKNNKIPNSKNTTNKSNIRDKKINPESNKKLKIMSINEELVQPSDFICLAQLGQGSFGAVFLTQKNNTDKKYAMKVLRKERIIGQNLLKYAIAERNILSANSHPFIVKLGYAFQTLSKLFLAIEYCPNGDLSKHLLYEKKFPESRAKFYICEVLLALENLHQRDIIYRDLKPDNVILDKDGHCKLTDFGLSKEGICNGNEATKSFCGSIAYLAPEMLKKQGHGKAVDWYLLGVLFYEMLVGVTPYFTGKKEEIFKNILYGDLIFPNYVSSEARGILTRLLEKDPNKRLGGGPKDAKEIKEHPYFKDVDWDKVYNKKIPPPKFAESVSKFINYFNKPRIFANDKILQNSNDDINSNMVKGWYFVS